MPCGMCLLNRTFAAFSVNENRRSVARGIQPKRSRRIFWRNIEIATLALYQTAGLIEATGDYAGQILTGGAA